MRRASVRTGGGGGGAGGAGPGEGDERAGDRRGRGRPAWRAEGGEERGRGSGEEDQPEEHAQATAALSGPGRNGEKRGGIGDVRVESEPPRVGLDRTRRTGLEQDTAVGLPFGEHLASGAVLLDRRPVRAVEDEGVEAVPGAFLARNQARIDAGDFGPGKAGGSGRERERHGDPGAVVGHGARTEGDGTKGQSAFTGHADDPVGPGEQEESLENAPPAGRHLGGEAQRDAAVDRDHDGAGRRRAHRREFESHGGPDSGPEPVAEADLDALEGGLRAHARSREEGEDEGEEEGGGVGAQVPGGWGSRAVRCDPGVAFARARAEAGRGRRSGAARRRASGGGFTGAGTEAWREPRGPPARRRIRKHGPPRAGRRGRFPTGSR